MEIDHVRMAQTVMFYAPAPALRFANAGIAAQALVFYAPGWDRTSHKQFRKLLLYPNELQAQIYYSPSNLMRDKNG